MLHTRVIMKVWHPSGFCERVDDRGARFRDDADIARVMKEMRASVKRDDRRIEFVVREV